MEEKNTAGSILSGDLTLSDDKFKKQYAYGILISIILTAFFIRVLFWGENPPALNQDEAMHGYNAYSISRTLKDQQGYFLPAQMHGFGNIGIVSSLYTYLDVPIVGLFGLNETTTRLPALLINLGLIFVVYLTGARFFSNRIIGLIAAFLLSLNPWHIHYSRIAHEASLCAFFYLLIALLYHIVLTDEKRKYVFWLAGVVFGISFYTYQVAWVMSHIVVTLLCFVFWPDTMKRWKEILISIVIADIIMFPIIYMNWIAPAPWMESRLDSVSLLGRPDSFTRITNNYLSFFSFSFLFFNGGMNVWTLPGNARQYGMFHFYILFFMIAGLIYLILHFASFKKFRREFIVVIAFIVLYPLPAAFTEPEGWSLRAYTLIPAFHLLGAIGIWGIIASIPVIKLRRVIRYGLTYGLTYGLAGLISLIIVVTVIPFLVKYYTVYPKLHENYYVYQYGMKEVVEYIETHQVEYESVYMSRDVNQPFIYILFYTRYDPVRWHAIEKIRNMKEWGAVFEFDKYKFVLNIDMDSLPEKALYITSADYHVKNKKLLKEIIAPDGRIQFRIWRQI
jgi:4-amino-4-deoxy-L-arabinose transferase-like glycosyltransferase